MMPTLENRRFRNEVPFHVYRLGRKLCFRFFEVDASARSQAFEAAA